jgi:hypothetical protein
MKLLRSNGKILEIYDLGHLLMTVTKINMPVKENGWQIVDDDIARGKVSTLIDSNLYDVRAFRNGSD